MTIIETIPDGLPLHCLALGCLALSWVVCAEVLAGKTTAFEKDNGEIMANRESEQPAIPALSVSPRPHPDSSLKAEAESADELRALRRLVCELLQTNQELREAMSADCDFPSRLERNS